MRVRSNLLTLLLALLLTACGGEGPMPPPQDGPAPISTFAYVVNECSAAPGEDVGPMRQVLWVRQGERDPVQIAALSLSSLPRDLCLFYGENRSGYAAVLVGGFQRLGITPDGSTVVFEISDDFSLFRGFVPKDEKGFFVVGADGDGRRRLADASRQAHFATDWSCYLFGGSDCAYTASSGDLDFTPNNRQFVFIDRGADATGKAAPQIFTLDVASGARTQLTFLEGLPRCQGPVDPDAACVPPGRLSIEYPRFLDAHTVAFYGRVSASTLVQYTVDTRTRTLAEVPVVAIPGTGFVPVYQITGPPLGFTVFLPGLVPVNGRGANGNIVSEAFTFNGRETLQLTAFGRSDTWQTRSTRDGGRVVFVASADPLGTNPTHACEVFSIDPLGRDLRQLTHLGAGVPAGCNCGYCDCGGAPCEPPLCSSGLGGIDWQTGSLVLNSTCDPFGTNPYGEQILAMRPDGTGLRPLTDACGLRQGEDGSLAVELVGPWVGTWRYR